MYPPVDYPVNDDPSNAAPSSDDMTYAALLYRHESKEVITEAMIQSACLRIETAQQLPFASKPTMQGLTEKTHESALDALATTKQESTRVKERSTGTPVSIKLSTAMDLSIIAQPAAKALSRWIRVIS
jgi:hypothetical protein